MHAQHAHAALERDDITSLPYTRTTKAERPSSLVKYSPSRRRERHAAAGRATAPSGGIDHKRRLLIYRELRSFKRIFEWLVCCARQAAQGSHLPPRNVGV